MKRRVDDEYANRILEELRAYTEDRIYQRATMIDIAFEMTRETYRNTYENTKMYDMWLTPDTVKDFIMGMLGGGDFPFSSVLSESLKACGGDVNKVHVISKDGQWTFELDETAAIPPERDAYGRLMSSSWIPGPAMSPSTTTFPGGITYGTTITYKGGK